MILIHTVSSSILYIQIFELQLDDENKMYISKQIFISRGFRPLYVWPLERVPKIYTREMPEFKENRERMFLEAEEMQKNDFDSPFVVDTRTDEEKNAWKINYPQLEVEAAAALATAHALDDDHSVSNASGYVSATGSKAGSEHTNSKLSTDTKKGFFGMF